jgi:hypothetical protein
MSAAAIASRVAAVRITDDAARRPRWRSPMSTVGMPNDGAS